MYDVHLGLIGKRVLDENISKISAFAIFFVQWLVGKCIVDGDMY